VIWKQKNCFKPVVFIQLICSFFIFGQKKIENREIKFPQKII